MSLVDTHCHIHEADYKIPPDVAIAKAVQSGVTKLICVGTDEITSREAVEFVQNRNNCWASIGLHPHDAKSGVAALHEIRSLIKRQKVVAIGECGLDYYYDNSPKQVQKDMLHAQLQLAVEHNLPMIFHVREAFDDFWPILTQYKGVKGVLHSFTDSVHNLHIALKHGLFIGVNGISTFTKDPAQQAMFAAIPLQKLLIETDAPFLTPVPKRGMVNEPAFASFVAQKQADLRNITLQELSEATSQNAKTLFSI